MRRRLLGGLACGLAALAIGAASASAQNYGLIAAGRPVPGVFELHLLNGTYHDTGLGFTGKAKLAKFGSELVLREVPTVGLPFEIAFEGVKRGEGIVAWEGTYFFRPFSAPWPWAQFGPFALVTLHP